MPHLIAVSMPTAIATLNDLLRGERAAVASYELASRHAGAAHADDLEANRLSHARRRGVLIRRIVDLGGTAAAASGAWTGFPWQAGDAPPADPAAVISALERSEDLALDTCYEALADLDHVSLNLVLQQVLPAQKRSHQRMAAIRAPR